MIVDLSWEWNTKVGYLVILSRKSLLFKLVQSPQIMPHKQSAETLTSLNVDQINCPQTAALGVYFDHKVILPFNKGYPQITTYLQLKDYLVPFRRCCA